MEDLRSCPPAGCYSAAPCWVATATTSFDGATPLDHICGGGAKEGFKGPSKGQSSKLKDE